MIGRIWTLAVKEYIQLVRDRMMTAFILIFPIAQLVLLAQATGHGIENLALGVLDEDRTSQSRALAVALDNVPELQWQWQPLDRDELAAQIEGGAAVVGVVIPSGFGAALTAAQPTTPISVQVLVDGSNSVVGSTAKGAVEGAIAEYVRRALLERASRGTQTDLIGLFTSIRYNPALSTRLFTIPAQIGFIIYQVTLAVSSLAFARERELGTLEQLLVTPLRRLELIMGKGALALMVGALDFLVMYALMIGPYAVPMRGSFALLFGLSLVFVAVEIGYGIIISCMARSQQQAILYVFLLAMLDVALSGYLVPVNNMPALFRTLAVLSPLQHYLVIIRSITLKGADLAVLIPQAVALVVIGAVVALGALTVSARRLE